MTLFFLISDFFSHPANVFFVLLKTFSKFSEDEENFPNFLSRLVKVFAFAKFNRGIVCQSFQSSLEQLGRHSFRQDYFPSEPDLEATFTKQFLRRPGNVRSLFWEEGIPPPLPWKPPFRTLFSFVVVVTPNY